VDPKTNLFPEVAYVVEKSGKQVTYQQYSANNYSLTTLNFSTLPNNRNMIIPRKLLMKLPFSFYFYNGAVQVSPQIGINDGPRACSFANSVLSSTALINGGNVNVVVSEIIHALMKYGPCKSDREKWWSTDCVMKDFYQNYEDWSLWGSSRNVLSNIGENASEPTRGGYPFTVNPDGSYSYVFYCPLYLLSPFESGNDNNLSGFINVENLQINMQLGNLSRMWSHSSLGPTITNINVVWSGPPQLIIQQITPSDISPIPSLSVYNYNNIQYYPNVVGSLAPGATSQVTSQTLTPNQIPRRMMVYACRQFNDWTFNTTDTFARITNLSIQWNNSNNLLSTCTEADLYRISVKNGYDPEGGFPAWSAYTGAVISLNPCEDLNLGALEANGLQEKFNVTVNATIQNINNSKTITFALYVIFIYDGILSINQNGQAVTNTAILTKTNVLEANAGPQVDFREVRDMSGGGLFDKLKSFVNVGSKVIRGAAQVAKQVAPQYAAPLSAVENLAGVAQNISGGRMRRRGARRISRRHGRRRGFGLVGAGLLPNSDSGSASEDEVLSV
jgi:hypothetical protein